MAILDQMRADSVAGRSGFDPYSVRRSLAIIAGLSLGFWGALGWVVVKLL
jgi:hypothetical protein